MLRLSFGQFEIEIDNDPTFSFGSVDNPHNYDHAYRLDDDPYAPTSLHSVRIVGRDGKQIISCILGASGGASGIHEHSAIVHVDSLVIAVGPFMALLYLPTFELEWKAKVDTSTCFGVYDSPGNQCFISHGELDIARVSYEGVIDWSHSGADIFTNGFSVSADRVTAIDWNEDEYVWDIGTGKAIRTPPTR